MSVECVGFSGGSFRWAASGGMDKTLKVSHVRLVCQCHSIIFVSFIVL